MQPAWPRAAAASYKVETIIFTISRQTKLYRKHCKNNSRKKFIDPAAAL
jgi:hypothetical protein